MTALFPSSTSSAVATRVRSFTDAAAHGDTGSGERWASKVSFPSLVLGSRHSSKLPARATEVLLEWFLNHQDNPYPSPTEKKVLCSQTNLSKKQIRNWFTNMRKRHWGPVRKGTQAPKGLLDMAILDAFHRSSTPAAHQPVG